MIKFWKIGAAALVVAAVVCWLAGLSPALPFVLAGLAWLAVRPVAGLGYVMIVLLAPLGLWFIRFEAFVGWAFGGREYALSLSSSVIACAALAVTLLRRRPDRRQLLWTAAGAVVLGIGALIGIGHHGFGQTAVGARLVLLPIILAVATAGLTARDLHRLVTLGAWLAIGNAIGAIAELIVGPAKLVEWGFEDGKAVRYIGETFRAPGLTEVNAELGLLGGAFLLGYAALWLTRDLRPRQWSWHAGAAAAALCLVLSTSRSGALLVAGGLVAATVLNRAGGAAARRRARILGAGVVVVLVGGFAALGATGSSSLFDRFHNWGNLLGEAPLAYGWGLGGAGAATTSRVVGEGRQVFVDNYFISIALQFGVPVMIAVLALAVWLLLRLSRRSADHPVYALPIAILAGLLLGSLMLETWEYTGAMMVLTVFTAYAFRAEPAPVPLEQMAVADRNA